MGDSSRYRSAPAQLLLFGVPNRDPSPDLARRGLQAMRDRRFAHGLRCVRCGARPVHRWGTFSGRQRYRCTQCRRTFSDLTATPIAYSKRLWLWPDYCACMLASLTLRASARRVGIHLSTAFRWRHALLSALGENPVVALGGLVEFDEIRLPYSRKGERSVQPARRRGARGPDPLLWRTRRVAVIVARDRQTRTFTQAVDTALLSIHDLLQHLRPRLLPAAIVLSRRGPLSSEARVAALAQGSYAHVPQRPRVRFPLLHLANVMAYGFRLLDWLLLFRGVATKYLDHYLAWHRYLDALSWTGRRAGLLAWPLPH